VCLGRRHRCAQHESIIQDPPAVKAIGGPSVAFPTNAWRAPDGVVVFLRFRCIMYTGWNQARWLGISGLEMVRG